MGRSLQGLIHALLLGFASAKYKDQQIANLAGLASTPTPPARGSPSSQFPKNGIGSRWKRVPILDGSIFAEAAWPGVAPDSNLA
jgi:hypothetical protein